MPGMLIAVDGPKNVGKTVLLSNVYTMLRDAGLPVMFTKEPTRRFKLDNEQNFRGARLARLIAQDRAAHLRFDIEPELAEGRVVVVDRYIASSLAFQGLDGMPFDEIWELNRRFRLPHLNIFVTANVPTLERRRTLRSGRTRLEQVNIDQEIAIYRHARASMRSRGIATVTIDNSDGKNVTDTAQAIAKTIVRVTALRGKRRG